MLITPVKKSEWVLDGRHKFAINVEAQQYQFDHVDWSPKPVAAGQPFSIHVFLSPIMQEGYAKVVVSDADGELGSAEGRVVPGSKFTVDVMAKNHERWELEVRWYRPGEDQ